MFALSPRLVDMRKVYRQTNLENLEQAFNVAEKELGVTRLLDPEGTRPTHCSLFGQDYSMPDPYYYSPVIHASLSLV